jgi:hypothetical protein
MKRNNLLIVVVAVAAIFLLFNPLKFLTGNKDAVPRPSPDVAIMDPLLQFAEQAWRSPQDYVLASLEKHDIVFLGEFYKISQNAVLVKNLIPRLYAAGIRNLGIEYALSDDQKDIDALVTAPAWNEAGARAIIFDWVVTWGYQEYVDVFKAAWQVNSTRPAGAPPFRIVGLSVRQDWSVLTSEKDLSDPAVVARMYARGVPDAHMAEVIQKEFLQKGLKALIYTGTQHAFTRYHSLDYEKNAATMKLPEVRRAGNIVAAAVPPGRVYTIALHAPWPDANQKNGLGYPAGGSIDSLIDALPADKKSGGWDIAGTPLGRLSIAGSSYASPAASTLADLFDGYVVQGPIREYTAVTAIADFIRSQDADRASREFPGVKAAPMTAKQVQSAIVQDVDMLQKALAQFQ